MMRTLKSKDLFPDYQTKNVSKKDCLPSEEDLYDILSSFDFKRTVPKGHTYESVSSAHENNTSRVLDFHELALHADVTWSENIVLSAQGYDVKKIQEQTSSWTYGSSSNGFGHKMHIKSGQLTVEIFMIHDHSTSINRWSVVMYQTLNRPAQFLERGLTHLDKFMINGLRQAGFVARRDIHDLEKEVERRQIQYPGKRLVGVIGTELGQYIRDVYEGKYLDVDWIIRKGENCYSMENKPWIPNSKAHKNEIPAEYGFHGWESAIYTPEQIRYKHEHTYSYGYTRIPRAWETNTAIELLMGYEIDLRVP